MEIFKGVGPIVVNDCVRVMIKSLNEGEELAKHKHPDMNLVIFSVLEGSIIITIDRKSQPLVAGDVFTFEGNCTISATALAESKIQVVLVK